MTLAFLLTLCVAKAHTNSCSLGSCPDDEVSLLQTKSDTRQRSELDVLRSQGYSQGLASVGDAVAAANEDLKTGEDGETIYHPMGHPNLYRVTFASKSEDMLRNDRKIMADQLVVDRLSQDMEQALTELKAEIYHSGDASRWREEQLMKAETAKRRMQLLATLNMQKADNTKLSAEEYKSGAFWEKELHAAEAKILQERDERRNIFKQELKEQEKFYNETKSNMSVSDSVYNALAMDRRTISDWEKKESKNMTKALGDMGLKGFDKGLSEKKALKANDEMVEGYSEFLDSIGMGSDSAWSEATGTEDSGKPWSEDSEGGLTWEDELVPQEAKKKKKS